MTSTPRDQFDDHPASGGHGDAQLLQLRDAPTTEELASVLAQRAVNDAPREPIERVAALDVLARCMAYGALGG